MPPFKLTRPSPLILDALAIATVLVILPALWWFFSPPSDTAAGAAFAVRSTDGSMVTVTVPWPTDQVAGLDFVVGWGPQRLGTTRATAYWAGGAMEAMSGPFSQNSSVAIDPNDPGRLRITTDSTVVVYAAWDWRGPWDTLPWFTVVNPRGTTDLRVEEGESNVEVAVMGVEFSVGTLGYLGRGSFAATDTDGQAFSGRLGYSEMGRTIADAVEWVPVGPTQPLRLLWGEFGTVND